MVGGGRQGFSQAILKRENCWLRAGGFVFVTAESDALVKERHHHMPVLVMGQGKTRYQLPLP